MSVLGGVTCLDCKQRAPEIGDGGFIGAPSLDISEHVETSFEAMPSFGRLEVTFTQGS